jgi:uncharacterized protein GlcG (DUF336 family)
MKTAVLVSLTFALLTVPGMGAAPAEAQAITLEEAKKAMDAAEAEARKNNWNMVFVIVDADGTPKYLRRMEGPTAKNYEIAMGKVRTALASGMHTADYAAALKAGKTKEVPNGVTFAGGYPLRRGGTIVGAMSASGARGVEDAQAVRAGMAAIGIEP